MAALQSITTVNSAASQTITGTTETTILTSAAIPTPSPLTNVCVLLLLQITMGTTQSAITCRVRRTSLTGTALGSPQALSVTGAALQGLNVMYTDTLTNTDSVVYVATVQQGGGAGNGTVSQATMLVFTF